MKLLTFSCVLALISLVGCSATQIVPRDPESKGFIQARDRLKGAGVVVKRTEAGLLAMDRVSLQTDTLFGFIPMTQRPVNVSLSEVDEITVPNVMRGMTKGFCIGLALGGSLGVFVGGVLLPGGSLFRGPGEGVDWKGIAEFSLASAGLGALLGARSLSTDHYWFAHEGDSRIESGGPDASPRQEDVGLDGLLPTEVITLKSWLLSDEKPGALCILWDNKPIWLPKSRLKFDRLWGGKINLTVPKSLLEAPRDKGDG